jgi:hypothetical protein
MLAHGSVWVEGRPSGIDREPAEQALVKEGLQPPRVLTEGEEEPTFGTDIDSHGQLLKIVLTAKTRRWRRKTYSLNNAKAPTVYQPSFKSIKGFLSFFADFASSR